MPSAPHAHSSHGSGHGRCQQHPSSPQPCGGMEQGAGAWPEGEQPGSALGPAPAHSQHQALRPALAPGLLPSPPPPDPRAHSPPAAPLPPPQSHHAPILLAAAEPSPAKNGRTDGRTAAAPGTRPRPERARRGRRPEGAVRARPQECGPAPGPRPARRANTAGAAPAGPRCRPTGAPRGGSRPTGTVAGPPAPRAHRPQERSGEGPVPPGAGLPGGCRPCPPPPPAMQGHGRGAGVARLQQRLGAATQENTRLRRTLRQAEAGVSQLQAELERLRRDFGQRAQRRTREQQALRELVEENLAFTSYVRMLQATNRSLCESNSSLRSALLLGSCLGPGAPPPPLQPRSPLADPSPCLPEDAHSRYRGGSSPRPQLPATGPRQNSASSTDTASLSDAGSWSSEDARPTSPCWDTQDPAPPAEGCCQPAQHCCKRKLPAFPPEGSRAAEEPAPPCPMYRLVLAGDSGTGKSSFLMRLCMNEFRDVSATLGVDFQIKQLLVDGEQTTLQIWDTAGQERYRSIAQSYFRKAHGVLLLYDISSQSSFLSIRQWIEDIKQAAETALPLMLVGNKTDLRPGLPEAAGVRTAHGQKLAMVSSHSSGQGLGGPGPPPNSPALPQAHNCLFCETSAKDGTNVVEAVLHLAREVKRTAGSSSGHGVRLDASIPPPRAAPRCCRA
ncbi:ras and EF-hand domain-containing protein-like [Anser cygnoides]|uniref:ras and EF-hand domain-containing protein-like n=1 Tax=Anser cygnoides TaxID=8845 RepID=UPI0034D1A525